MCSKNLSLLCRANQIKCLLSNSEHSQQKECIQKPLSIMMVTLGEILVHVDNMSSNLYVEIRNNNVPVGIGVYDSL